MFDEPVDKNLLELLGKLQARYEFMGQYMASNPERLPYSEYLAYCDYIQRRRS